MNLLASLLVLVAVVVLIDARSFQSFRSLRRFQKERRDYIPQSLQGYTNTLSGLQDPGTILAHRDGIIEHMGKVEKVVEEIRNKGYDLDSVTFEGAEQEIFHVLAEIYYDVPNVDPRGDTHFLSNCYADFQKVDFPEGALDGARKTAVEKIGNCLNTEWKNVENDFARDTEGDGLSADMLVKAFKNALEKMPEFITTLRFEQAIFAIEQKMVDEVTAKLQPLEDLGTEEWEEIYYLISLIGGDELEQGIREVIKGNSPMDIVMKYLPFVLMGDGSGEETKKRTWMTTDKKKRVQSLFGRKTEKSNIETKRMLEKLLQRLQKK